MRTLKDLFLDELADRYDSEKRLVIALPQLIRLATCERLRKLIGAHLMETESHVTRVEKVFRLFGAKPRLNKSEAILGLLAEGAEVACENKGLPVINAALVASMQKIEHYEMASYGCLREWAMLLGNKPAVSILKELLREEKTSNRALHKLARSYCNDEALNAATADYPSDQDQKVKRRKRKA